MFEELIEKINTIEANVNLLLELHLEQSNSLTTYNDVAKFLGVTRKTIYNYVKEGKFVEDTHYYTNDKGTPTFIASAIIEFKKGVKAVDTNIYLTVLGIKFTIKEKFNKWHIAFNIDSKRKNRSTGLEATKKNLITVKNEILPQFAQELIALKSSTQSSVIVESDVSVLESVADIHFSLHKENVRPHVYTRQVSNYNRHILPYFKGRQLSSIKPMEIESWQNRLLTKYKVLSVRK